MPPVLDQCARERAGCLYLPAAADDAATVSASESHGFRLVDTRVTLERQAAARGVPARRAPGQRRGCARPGGDRSRKGCAGDAEAVLVNQREGRAGGLRRLPLERPIGAHRTARGGRAGGSGAGRELVEAALATFAAHGAAAAVSALRICHPAGGIVSHRRFA